MYEHIDSTDPLVETVWYVLTLCKGYENRISRNDLVYSVYGEINDNLDRKVRDALAELPVIWNDGYFVPTSYTEAADYIAGMRSRQAAIGQRLRVLDDYLRAQREPVSVRQLELMEVG